MTYSFFNFSDGNMSAITSCTGLVTALYLPFTLFSQIRIHVSDYRVAVLTVPCLTRS